jgi:hypothetical protein
MLGWIGKKDQEMSSRWPGGTSKVFGFRVELVKSTTNWCQDIDLKA